MGIYPLTMREGLPPIVSSYQDAWEYDTLSQRGGQQQKLKPWSHSKTMSEESDTLEYSRSYGRISSQEDDLSSQCSKRGARFSPGMSPHKLAMHYESRSRSPSTSVTRSPMLKKNQSRSKSSGERSRSPGERSRSPGERSKSPDQRSKSPGQRSKSPGQRSKSPGERSSSSSSSRRSAMRDIHHSGTEHSPKLTRPWDGFSQRQISPASFHRNLPIDPSRRHRMEPSDAWHTSPSAEHHRIFYDSQRSPKGESRQSRSLPQHEPNPYSQCHQLVSPAMFPFTAMSMNGDISLGRTRASQRRTEEENAPIAKRLRR